MANDEQISQFTLEEKQRQLDLLQAEVDKIFASAMKRKLNTIEFAIEIWVNAILEKDAYVAIACRMIGYNTHFEGNQLLEFMRYLANGTLEQNESIAQRAVNLINQGLITNNSLKIGER
ncbi:MULTISPECIES: hypothetical protein [unclassified Microcoleus]|uniref:hypothetical protein n=1 Tax=unclassified Microcoleus TaxID=2642155 RepID=UPI002FD6DD18